MGKRQDQVNAINKARLATERDRKIPPIGDPGRREQLEDDDAAWLRFYLPDVFFHPFTDDQLEMIHDVAECLDYGILGCKAAERGGGKSSILKYLMAKRTLQKKNRLWFPVVIAATGPKATKTTASVRRRLASKSPTSQQIAAIGARGGSTAGLEPNFLAEDYPLECFIAQYINPSPLRAANCTATQVDEQGEPIGESRPISVEWGKSSGYFILPTWTDEIPLGPIWMSIGWSSDELQGLNIYDRRPDGIMLDDLDSRYSLASAYNEDGGVVASQIENCIETTIAGLGGQTGGMGQYFLGTCASHSAAITKYSDPKQKPWNGKRVPAIKTWPTNLKLWDQYIHLWQKGKQEGDQHTRIAHQFYVDHYEEMRLGASVSNPHRFDATILPDGSQVELDSLQRCFNYIAKHGRDSFDTEYQQSPPRRSELIETKVTGYHIGNCAGDYDRRMCDPTVQMVVGGVDVRKTEIHPVVLASEEPIKHRIADYTIETFGHGTETTVEQAEELILRALRGLADQWKSDPITDINGMHHSVDLCLVDCGWMGSFKTEDGVEKSWVTQPVETFCVEQGLRNWLPAKGESPYHQPKPARGVIIGPNWHINRGSGAKRRCDQVVWNSAHYHLLVEELFMLDDDDPDRFELFLPDDDPHGIYTNHKAFGNHIVVGASELKKELNRGSRSRKPRFVRDHWWDSLAMALVAKSIESHYRERAKNKKASRPLSQMGKNKR